MNRRRHLHEGVSALVDGELGHDARDRALAHLAHCDDCRVELDVERSLKARLAAAAAHEPSDRLIADLLALSDPGEPVPPRSRTMPLAPVVPTLPRPGRSSGSRGPRGRRDVGRPADDTYRRGARRTRQVRFAAAGALSVGVLLLATAFAAGGARPQQGTPVLPPAAELSVEHAATTAGMPLSDPAFDAVTASFGGLSFPTAVATTAPGR